MRYPMKRISLSSPSSSSPCLSPRFMLLLLARVAAREAESHVHRSSPTRANHCVVISSSRPVSLWNSSQVSAYLTPTRLHMHPAGQRQAKQRWPSQSDQQTVPGEERMAAERSGIGQAANVPKQECAIPDPDMTSAVGNRTGPCWSFPEYGPSRCHPLRHGQRSDHANDPKTRQQEAARPDSRATSRWLLPPDFGCR